MWRDRFRSRIIQDLRSFLWEVYVEANPVEAGLVNRCEDWPYSSSRYYFKGERDLLVDGYSYDGDPTHHISEPEGDKRTIGSEIFRILHEEGIFTKDNNVSVPG